MRKSQEIISNYLNRNDIWLILIELCKSNDNNIIIFASQSFYRKEQTEWFRLKDDEKIEIHKLLINFFDEIVEGRVNINSQALNYLCLSSGLFVYSKPENIQPYLTQIFKWLLLPNSTIQRIELCLLLIKTLPEDIHEKDPDDYSGISKLSDYSKPFVPQIIEFIRNLLFDPNGIYLIYL